MRIARKRFPAVQKRAREKGGSMIRDGPDPHLVCRNFFEMIQIDDAFGPAGRRDAV